VERLIEEVGGGEDIELLKLLNWLQLKVRTNGDAHWLH